MLTRRSLFARLSAVALAPLVKWVPKAEASHTNKELLWALKEFERRNFDAMVKRGEEYMWGDWRVLKAAKETA